MVDNEGLSKERAKYFKNIETAIEELLVQGIPFWELVMAKGCPSSELSSKALRHFKLVASLPDGSERVLDETWIFRSTDLGSQE